MKGLQGGKTNEQIDALKAKYGKIFLIEVTCPNTQEPLYFWFKKPDMKVFSAAATYAEQPFKMGKILFDNLLIDGAKEVSQDVDIFPAIIGELSTTIKTAKAKIKEF